MNKGLCTISVIPIRREASHKSEMVTQLLFGEAWELILEDGDWLHIRCLDDGYEGWLDRRQARWAKAADLQASTAFTLDLVHSATSKDRHVLLPLGSTLRAYDGLNFKLLQEKLVYNGQATDPGNSSGNAAAALKMARKFLGVPYLWGGRSPFGIDCSGLVQVVAKVAGLRLPRDARDQALTGDSIDFIHQAAEGDLAYFDAEDGRIVHVGLLTGNGFILHASGQVRLDPIDQQGIFDREAKKYSHRLRLIKRPDWNA